jgi:hypothetical protein
LIFDKIESQTGLSKDSVQNWLPLKERLELKKRARGWLISEQELLKDSENDSDRRGGANFLAEG